MKWLKDFLSVDTQEIADMKKEIANVKRDMTLLELDVNDKIMPALRKVLQRNAVRKFENKDIQEETKDSNTEILIPV